MKTVIVISGLIVSILLITSCSKSSTDASIIGTWQSTHYHQVNVDSTTNPVTVTTSDTNYTDVITFGSNGYAMGYDNTNMVNGIIGSYYLIGSDSISYVFGPGPPPEKARYTIQGSTLTLFASPHYLYDSLHYFITTQTYKRLK
jgi:hypothetical protein